MVVSGQNWCLRIRWTKMSGYRTPTVCELLCHIRQTCVCVFSCVLFKIAGGRWGRRSEWWNIFREKQSPSCLRRAAFAQAASWVSDQLGQVELETDKNTRQEGKAERSVVHLHHGAMRHYKNKHWIHENKRRVWFCISESGSHDWHPCVSVAGGGAVRLHGPSSCSDALSKHGPPSLDDDCNMIRIPVIYINMPISPLHHSWTCSSCG